MRRVRNATQFCELVEQELGWENPNALAVQSWKVYGAEAAKVKREIAKNADLFTWRNLMLAVELLKNERECRTPVGVFSHVERAVEMATAPVTDLESDVQNAIAFERHRGDPDGWVGRFVRSAIGYQPQLLREWRAAS